MNTVFLVEDDSSIRELVVYTLNNSGFLASGFSESTAFWEAVRQTPPSLVLLDIMLPGESGLQILKRIRGNAAYHALPVIMLTAKTTEYDRVIGLDGGADDYISKPFGMMELISRIKAVLRRADTEEKTTLYTVGGLTLNSQQYTVVSQGVPVALTRKEFELLKLLLENKNTVLTRNQILENIWGYDFDGETRTVDVHIRTLRAKLGRAGAIVETVRGIGYKISNQNNDFPKGHSPI